MDNKFLLIIIIYLKPIIFIKDILGIIAKIKIKALIEFLVFDLDVELGILKNVEVFYNLSVRQTISYMIWVKIDLSQIGFYL